MEVDNVHFHTELLSILGAIANAKFVSIDVEMSGISVGRLGSNDRSYNASKPTLQQVYEEKKEAAERYQIVQIGITTIEEDREKGINIARPFNFYLKPTIPRAGFLGLSRDIVFSSISTEFLLKNGFDMAALFTKGVPYISRQEEAVARVYFAGTQDRYDSIPEVIISTENKEASAFYEEVRRDVTDFVASTKKEQDVLNVGRAGGLNRYQQRLVFQLIRKEFPGYKATIKQNGLSMHIEKLDEQHEAMEATKAKTMEFEEKLAHAIGWRLIIEALTGNIQDIDPKWFCLVGGTNPEFRDIDAKRQEITKLKASIKEKKPILVGHNLLTDLVFMYRAFVGPLPAKVSDFKQEIKSLFPLILDTKYLATHDAGVLRSNSGLRDIYDEAVKQPTPPLSLHEKHTKYKEVTADHEAGYDSWMTAVVFTKLSAKLEAELKQPAERSPSKLQKTYSSGLMKSNHVGLSLEWRQRSVEVQDRKNINMSNLRKTSAEMLMEITTQLKRDSNRLDHPVGGNTSTNENSIPYSSPHLSQNRFSGLDVFDHSDGEEDPGSVRSERAVLRLIPLSPKKRSFHLSDPFLPAGEQSLLDVDIDNSFKQAEREFPHLRSYEVSNWRSPRSVSPRKDVFNRPTSPTKSPTKRDRRSKDLHAARALHAWRPNPSSFSQGEKHGPVIGEWIPDVDSDFWTIYGNKLRVYAAESEVFDLNA